MNFEEVSKKYFNPSDDEDSASLASSTSDVSFTLNKKEQVTKVETSVISSKSDDTDSLQDLIKAIEKHDEIKLDESLQDKANEIFDYLKDTSESSNPTESKSLDQSLNDADLKKVADNLDNSQLNESLNESVAESENDSELKQVAQNLEASLNESLNESSLEETLPQTKEAVLNESQNSEQNGNLSQIVNDIVQPLRSENLTPPVSENDSEQSSASTAVEKNPEDSQTTLSQIMQFVTGLTTLGATESSQSENLPEAVDQSFSSEEKELKLTDLVKEIQRDLESSQQTNDESVSDESKSESNTSKSSDELNTSSEQSSEVEVKEVQLTNVALRQEVETSDESQPSEHDQTQASEDLNASVEESEKSEINVSRSEPQLNESQEPAQEQIANDISELIKEAVEEIRNAQEESQKESPVEERAVESLVSLARELISEKAPEEQAEKVEEVKVESPVVEEIVTEKLVLLAQELVSAPESVPEQSSESQPEQTLESQTESVEEVKQTQELQAQPPVVDSQEQPQVVEEEIAEKIVSLAQELAAPVAESQPVVESQEQHQGIVGRIVSLAQELFSGPTTTEQLESQTESVEEVKQTQDLQAQPTVVDSQEQPQVVEEVIAEKIVSLAQELAAPVAESQPVVESEELKNSEEGIVEKLASLAQDLFSAPSEELQQTPVLIEETRSESEVRRTYLVGNDVVIEAVGCPLFQPDDILLRKDEILNKYKINDEQFELCRDFFNEKRDGTNLNNSLLRVLMREALKVRSQVKANEQDVDRALEAVDENKDDKITFDEFVQLLLLFFSSKNNVENRVSNILKAKLNSETLSANDAVEFANFLNKFYGRQDNSEEFKDGLDVTDFLKDILPSLGTLAYVQPEPEVTEEKVENVEVAGEEVAKEEN